MHTETLFSLIEKIRVQRIRLSHHSQHPLSSLWTTEEEDKLYDLMQLYGADFGIIHAHFPMRSHKQIRRKYLEVENRYCRKLQRLQETRLKERRKNYFDEDIMQSNMIKWPKKHNIAESSSSEESV